MYSHMDNIHLHELIKCFFSRLAPYSGIHISDLTKALARLATNTYCMLDIPPEKIVTNLALLALSMNGNIGYEHFWRTKYNAILASCYSVHLHIALMV